jgi:hypothetical protein
MLQLDDVSDCFCYHLPVGIPSDAPSSPSTVAAASPAAEGSEEDEYENSEEGDEAGGQPEEPVVATMATSVKITAQAGIFDTHNEEEEILQEAFYGTQDSHIAA